MIAEDSAPTRLEVTDLRIESADGRSLITDDVSFSVAEGEICGLVGESGSGKTSIALSLLGHVRPGLRVSGGSISLDGVDVLSLPPADLRRIRGSAVAYVPQDPTAALNPSLRVRDQLHETLTAHPQSWGQSSAEDRIAEILLQSGLRDVEGVLRAYPHQLSGGQQQRVGIALAFACAPSLIVLDEPTTGLDVTTQRHVLDTLRRLCSDTGTSAVYVSHDLAVTAELAASVVVLYAGRVVERGSTERVFQSPVHPYSQGLLRAAPSSERSEVLVGIPGTPPRPDQRPSGCDFAPRCAHTSAACTLSVPELVLIEDGRHVRCVHPPASSRTADARAERVRQAASALDIPAALAVSDLTAAYSGKRVLHGVSLSVRAGECVAVVGESGSGKTTLARCISGMASQWDGAVSLEGATLPQRARERSHSDLKSIQYVFQNPYQALNPRRTIGDLLEQPLRQFFPSLTGEERRERVAQVLTDVSLSPSVRSKFPAQMSGGERQRVAIARALAVEPRVLICDEVTSALDVSVQASTVELLRRLQSERQFAMVFITHNLALVRSIAQSVIVLKSGRIVESGSADAVLDQPQEEYTARLIADAPKLADAGLPWEADGTLDAEVEGSVPAQ